MFQDSFFLFRVDECPIFQKKKGGDAFFGSAMSLRTDPTDKGDPKPKPHGSSQAASKLVLVKIGKNPTLGRKNQSRRFNMYKIKPITIPIVVLLLILAALIAAIASLWHPWSHTTTAETPAVVTTQQPSSALGANGLPRRESGQNNTIAFNPGEMVYGWRIMFSDGRMCDGGQCFVTSAPLPAL
jgi:hypothetical protein